MENFILCKYMPMAPPGRKIGYFCDFMVPALAGMAFVFRSHLHADQVIPNLVCRQHLRLPLVAGEDDDLPVICLDQPF